MTFAATVTTTMGAQAALWLIAGLDRTGNGGIVAGVQSSSLACSWYGDLREVERLVEAGFTPLKAIKIATFNCARFLAEDSSIGSIAV